MNKAFIILFIFLLAFSIRIIYSINNDTKIEADEITYNRLALRLSETGQYINENGKPAVYRPPLYPAFLALLYVVFGHSLIVAKAGQAFLSAFTVIFLYLTCEKIFDRKSAIISGIAACFYMTFVACSNMLYTETLFTFLLTLIVYLVISTNAFTVRRFAAIGVLCGFLTLTRGSTFFLPFIFALILTLKMRTFPKVSLKKAVFTSLIIPLFFMSTVLPWTIRNYAVSGRFVLVSANAGINLYQAVRPVGGKIVGLGPRGDAVSEKAFSMTDEIDRDRYFMKSGLEAYKEDPVLALKMFILRFLFFWNVIDWEIMGGHIVNYHFLFMLPFFAIGIFYALKNRKDILLLSGTILYFIFLLLLFQGTPRYRMPIDGYIIVIGSYGISEFFKKLKPVTLPSIFTGIYFFLCYAVYANSLQAKTFLKMLAEKIGLW